MPTQAQEIVLREQDEIQEIIGHPPSWILRWGITVVLFLVALFGFMSWLIKYPDILSAPVILTTENPVIRIVANASGKIEQLFVSDQDSVQENQVIARIESNAKWEDVQQLSQLLKQLERGKKSLNLKIPEKLSVGDLQANYTRLVQLLKDQQYFLQQSNSEVKVAAAKQQIAQTSKLQESLNRQIHIYRKELQLAESNYKTSLQLYKDGASSLVEVERDEATYLQHQRQLESMQAQLITYDVTIAQLQIQIADLQQMQQDGEQSRQLAIEEITRQLKNDITTWEQTYLIKAPISGKIAMSKVWSSNQFVQTGTEIFTLVPHEGTGAIIAKAMMPTSGVGKVKTGMLANLTLEGYPQQEFGILKARVQNIALLPEPQQQKEKELGYQVELSLSDGLITTYDKAIALRQEMPGIAEIITEDKRIIDRVLEQILNILKNN